VNTKNGGKDLIFNSKREIIIIPNEKIYKKRVRAKTKTSQTKHYALTLDG